MQVIFYEKANGKKESKYFRIMETLNNVKKEHFGQFEKFKHRLVRRIGEETIVVFRVTDQDDMYKISSIRNLLRRVKLILVLPDDKESTVTRAHELHPCFLNFSDDDNSDLTAVLKKMTKNYVHAQNTIERRNKEANRMVL